MPDESHITFTVPDHHADTVGHLIQHKTITQPDLGWGLIADYPEPGDAQFECSETPWGNNNAGLSALRTLLEIAQIPYESQDHGHYTWTPDLVRFEGRRATVRTTTQDGQILATKSEVEAILDADDPHKALADHFS